MLNFIISNLFQGLKYLNYTPYKGWQITCMSPEEAEAPIYNIFRVYISMAILSTCRDHNSSFHKPDHVNELEEGGPQKS